MPLVLTPAYVCLFGALTLLFGIGEDAQGLILMGGAVFIAGLALAARQVLRRQLAQHLTAKGLSIPARVERIIVAPFRIGGARPYRLLCIGKTPPGNGRQFRSDWVLGDRRTATPSAVTVLVDPQQASRYRVEPWLEPITRAPLQGVLRHLGALALVLGACLFEVIATEAAKPEQPIGPVHGEVQANGARFGKGGLTLRPDSCRAASNPGVVAVALLRKEESFPIAWLIANPAGGLAALDIRNSQSADTIRFLPANCTRLHGAIGHGHRTSPASDLEGFADAECRQGGAELNIHVDFGGCH